MASLLSKTDLAMYAAKRAGRATIRTYEPALDRSARRLTVSTKLRRAVTAGTLDVAFQPVMHMPSGRPIAFEALARWTDPDLGPVTPDEFIPLAEDTGLIHDLFEVVLDRSLEAAVAWNSEALSTLAPRAERPAQDARVPGRVVAVGVNVAASQMLNPSLADSIERAARAHGFPLDALAIELTESAAMVENAAVDRTLRRLRDLGVVIVIDDHGVGCSSMARLRDLSDQGLLAAVKLDRSFITDLPSTRARVLLQSFGGLMQTLGLSAVAEGIETADHAAAVLAAGCAVGQGWHFAAGMTAEDAGTWLGAVTGAVGPRTRAPHPSARTTW